MILTTILVAALKLTSIDPGAVNNPAIAVEMMKVRKEPVKGRKHSKSAPEPAAAILRAQVLLARARFSPGEIDGRFGSNTAKAIRAFRLERGLPEGEQLDEAVWTLLNQVDSAPAVVAYTITDEDVKEPFPKIPEDMMAKASLPALGYESIREALGEKFHCSPSLLERLNPETKFDAGNEIMVPNVTNLPPLPKAASIVITDSLRSVKALDAEGKLIALYPATTGSEHDPLPVGKWKVLGVKKDPIFFYNPDLFWDAEPSHSKAKIQPGPNNPVGVVWIQVSKPHFGIHGSPEPSTIGKTQSHGCVRLTNWDALELASIVQPGTPVLMEK